MFRKSGAWRVLTTPACKWTKTLKYMLTNIKWLVASSLSRRA